ncbi:MAG: glycoside hydrolase family 3 protein [Rhizobiales bacterium]|nr:glycoside hydrolase family 3 protein [Hyphomicrobiales bacterium]
MRRLLLALMLPLMVASPAHAACIEAKSAPDALAIYGQLVMIGFTGSAASHNGVKEALAQVEQGYAGGLVFFGRNITGVKQIRSLTGLFSKHATGVKPFLAVDEEGGKVERLTPRNGFAKQPTARSIASRGPKSARQIYSRMAGDVAAAGFNFNLGPVVDLDLRRNNPIIGKLDRSYSRDPEVVAEYAQVFIEAHRQKKIATALKHFPGHGSSRRDSHVSVVDVTGDWQEDELIPYRELIADGLVDAVMMAHLINREIWSPENLPATFSRNAVKILREDLKFDGVIVSDDLQMAAIAKDHPLAQAIVQSLAAGNDMVLIGNVKVQQPEAAKFAVRTITDAVARGELDHSRLEQSFCRVMKLKKQSAGAG